MLLCMAPPNKRPRPEFKPLVAWDGTPMEGKLLNLSAVPKEVRGQIWARLQAERPAQADLIKSPEVQALRQAFDADVMVEDFE